MSGGRGERGAGMVGGVWDSSGSDSDSELGTFTGFKNWILNFFLI